MLPLDDPRWASLSHCYGSAADIPGLLQQLANDTGPRKGGYESEPWFSLWSSLCHQGDVFEASYAAVPHIVDIASKASAPLDCSFFQMPSAIEIARINGKGPPVRTDLAAAYIDALTRLIECIAKHLNDDWDKSTLLCAVSALAVVKGHHRIAEAILNLDNDLIDRLIALDF